MVATFPDFVRNQRDRAVAASASVLRTVFGLGFANKVSVSIIEQSMRLSYPINVRGRELRFQTIGPLPLYRARSLFSKEPETIAWIQGFGADDVMFDVGANVGMYSVYASAFCKRVYAFEPVFTNYFILNNNILLNNLSESVRAFCIAISDERRVDSMRLSRLGLGDAFSSFAESIDACHVSFQPVFEQGAFSLTLDALVFELGLECPTHLKVDVDGLESRIVGGAGKLLRDPRLRSILIELNHGLAADREAIGLIVASGFAISDGSGRPVTLNGMQVSNLIFVRKDQG
jgi:FkbM family methyltransferase